jgi:hypothetical protein
MTKFLALGRNVSHMQDVWHAPNLGGQVGGKEEDKRFCKLQCQVSLCLKDCFQTCYTEFSFKRLSQMVTRDSSKRSV